MDLRRGRGPITDPLPTLRQRCLDRAKLLVLADAASALREKNPAHRASSILLRCSRSWASAFTLRLVRNHLTPCASASRRSCHGVGIRDPW